MWKIVFLFGFLLVAWYGPSSCEGKFTKIDFDDKGFLAAVNFASKELSKAIRNPYHHKLDEIHQAYSQDINGIEYLMDISLRRTNCKKSEVEYEQIDNCDFQEVDKYYKCLVMVSRKNNGDHQLETSSCRIAP